MRMPALTMCALQTDTAGLWSDVMRVTVRDNAVNVSGNEAAMKYRSVMVTRAGVVLLAVWASGCASAPATPVKVEPTDQGVASVVSASLERTAEWTTRAFRDLGIQLQEVDADGDARQYFGIYKQLKVRAALKRSADGGTKVEVIAREDGSVPEKTYAQKVIERIVRNQH
jgi:hypothetical protein